MRLAIISLPVPVSPTISTLLSPSAMIWTKSKTVRIRGLRPTMIESSENGACVSSTAGATATRVPDRVRRVFRGVSRGFAGPRRTAGSLASATRRISGRRLPLPRRKPGDLADSFENTRIRPAGTTLVIAGGIMPTDLATPGLDVLIRRYDRPGPRYTSYPTAVEFHELFDAAAYGERLSAAAAAATEPLSLYVHLPFCEERCAYCGCTMIATKKRDVAAVYLDYLSREIGMLAARLG